MVNPISHQRLTDRLSYLTRSLRSTSGSTVTWRNMAREVTQGGRGSLVPHWQVSVYSAILWASYFTLETLLHKPSS